MIGIESLLDRIHTIGLKGLAHEQIALCEVACEQPVDEGHYTCRECQQQYQSA